MVFSSSIVLFEISDVLFSSATLLLFVLFSSLSLFSDNVSSDFSLSSDVISLLFNTKFFITISLTITLNDN